MTREFQEKTGLSEEYCQKLVLRDMQRRAKPEILERMKNAGTLPAER